MTTYYIIAAIVSILGLFVAVAGGIVFLLTLVFKIGTKVSGIDGKLEQITEKLSYLPQLFHIAESHGNRLTKIETRQEVDRTNGAWHDRD